MRTADLITKKLTEAFAPQSLSVEDESHQHEGHSAHREGGQTHFRVYIVSDAFKGKARLERDPCRGAGRRRRLTDLCRGLARQRLDAQCGDAIATAAEHTEAEAVEGETLADFRN